MCDVKSREKGNGCVYFKMLPVDATVQSIMATDDFSSLYKCIFKNCSIGSTLYIYKNIKTDNA